MKLKKPAMRKPPIKKPDLKIPPFVADLYYDLRDRRLLLPLALVVVAIAAVPFLLGGSEPVAPPPAAVGVGAEETESASASLAVVEARPGLRDYRKRLSRRTPTNPFEQRYTGLPESAKLESTSTSSSSSGDGSSSTSVTIEDSSTTVEADPGGSGGSGGDGSPSGSGGSVPDGGGVRLIEFVFNIQISHTEETAGGGQKMSEPEVRRRVPALTQLPGERTAVLTVAGVNLHNGRAFFLVSDDVKSLDGDFVCKTRTPDGLCELLEIEAGFPLELVYGPDEVLYRFKVTKIDAVWAGKPGDGERSPRAAFGGPALEAPPRP